MKKLMLNPLTILFFIFLITATVCVCTDQEHPLYCYGSLSQERDTSVIGVINGKVNINAATQKQLMLLPGIGEGLANRIISHRERYGPFNSPENLMDVKGIGQTRYNAVAEFITAGGTK